MPRMRILFAYLLLSSIELTQAEIFKCLNHYGQPSFSDRWCVVNAEPVTLVLPQSSGVDLGSTGDFSEIASENEQRDIVRRVAAMEKKRLSLRRDYLAGMTALDKRLRSLPNNPRGERERARLEASRKSLRNDYDVDKKQANERLRTLQSAQRKLH